MPAYTTSKPVIMWNNFLADPTTELTVTSENTGHPLENIYDWREYFYWQAEVAFNAQYFIYHKTSHANSVVNCLAVIGHNLFTAGCPTVKLWYGSDGSSWTEETNARITIADDGNVYVMFAARTAIFFRIEISTMTTVTPPYIGLLFLGDYLEFDTYPEATYSPNKRKKICETAHSEKGYQLGASVKFQERSLNLSFKSIAGSFITNTFDPFWDAHIPNPFLFALNISDFLEDVALVEVNEPATEAPYDPVYRELNFDIFWREDG